MKKIILAIFIIISISSFAQFENLNITNIINVRGQDYQTSDNALVVPANKFWVISAIGSHSNTLDIPMKIFVDQPGLGPYYANNHHFTVTSYQATKVSWSSSNAYGISKITFLIPGSRFWFPTGEYNGGNTPENDNFYYQIWEYDAPSSFTGTLASSEVEIPLNQDIKLFPNPTDSKLALNSNKDYELEVYDLSGRKLMQVTGNTLDMSVLSNATYIVKAFDKETKETNSYKVVKK